MAESLGPIDVSDLPEVLKIAEEVDATGVPRILRRHDEDLVLVVPLAARRGRRRRKTRTARDLEAFRSAAGSWRDEDTDSLIANTYASRVASRPPVDL